MITFTPKHFAGRDEAIAQINESGLYLAEAEISQDGLTSDAHVHPYQVDIYLLDGVLELDEPDAGQRHVLKAGSKAVVPSGTLHAETCPGRFHAVFGVSVDPVPIMAVRASEAPSRP